MVDKSHKTLTGNQLHENKGVDTADDNTVATVSSNSTVWQKLTASHLTGSGNPFGGQLLHLREEQNSGTGGASSITNSVWVTRVLNTTKTNEITDASLASNQITLPAGTYFVDAFCDFATQGSTTNAIVFGKIKVYNVTDSSDLLVGSQQRLQQFISGEGVSSQSVDATVKPSVRGRFTISGTKTIELRGYMVNGNSTGRPIGAGSVEVYADLLIWKVS